MSLLLRDPECEAYLKMQRFIRRISIWCCLAISGILPYGCSPGEPEPVSLWESYRSLNSCPELDVKHPFDKAVFPSEVPSPQIIWDESAQGCNRWIASVTTESGEVLFLDHAPRSGFHLPEKEWGIIRREAGENRVQLTIIGFDVEDPERIRAAGEVSFRFSRDPVGAPLFYREVNLPFIEAVKDPSRIRWRFGGVDSNAAPPVVLENLPVCGNCHSFSADGRIMGMDVDYANDKGSYAVTEVSSDVELTSENVFSWSESNPGSDEKTFGLLSQVSPDGRYVISTVRDRSVFVPRDELAFSQLFFPLKGILAVYDRERDVFFNLPGADDPRYVQSNPSWSPDGNYIVFARSDAYELQTLDDRGQVLLTQEDCAEFLAEGKEFKFDLYRIPFNLSNYFAKYSPDGNWIVFCQSASFMLLQPDSKLMIIPAKGGEPREMACNTSRMNSWHTWSPNGRWLAFSSKAFSPYTQLMIAHVDENGTSAPAVLMDRLTSRGRAANIPEFVNTDPTAVVRIAADFIDDESIYRAGLEYARAGDFENAERMYRKALKMNSSHKSAHVMLGAILGERGEYEEAVKHFNDAISIDPKLIEAYNNLGYIYMWKGDSEAAFGSFIRAVSINPRMVEAHIGIGVLRFETGEYGLAEKRFRTALGIRENSMAARVGLAKALRYQGKFEEALSVAVGAVRSDPRDIEALLESAEALLELNRSEEALIHFNRVLAVDPGNAQAMQGVRRIRGG